jgi:hypothetical protein
MMKRRGFLAATLVMASTMLSSQVVSSESSTASYVRGSNNNNNNNPQAQDATRSSVVGRKLSMERCLQDKATAERSEIGVECICKSKSNQGIVMVCSDQCAFCNDDQSVCGIKSTEALYDSEDGSRSGIGLVFEYLKPGTAMIDLLPKELISSATFGQGSHSDSNVNETKEGLPIVVLGIEEIGCQEDEETHNLNSCKECNVYLGGRRCNSCELVECGEEGSGIIAPVMNCTNIQSVSALNMYRNAHSHIQLMI